MKGIEYIIDDQGEKTAVVINLEQWGKEWETFYNLLLKQSFPSESWVHEDSFSKKLDKALQWNHNHPSQLSNLDSLEAQLLNNE
ncbi:hypothetical protein APA_348 [Pseudanabaena sp. lw0831]|uniref:hypothetical protein n=1 Tax=Pseudanabaena sp. lw0831 TaxID=1357935 RepID=UPI0019159958|nr:hypothetical protein [Pseudanabaena sp. lw0831]GBO52679.1 hypothetical protein APA_348 [Pseudanabaena sp. lw0831]